MRTIDSVTNNLRIVGSILENAGSKEEIHQSLDKLLNTVRITYESKQDFIDNFPAPDDLRGKIRLIVRRRR